jgi:hypothetical protein
VRRDGGGGADDAGDVGDAAALAEEPVERVVDEAVGDAVAELAAASASE